MTDRTVRILEVSPRDGLQNEPVALSVEDRLELIRLLAAAGLREIEAGAFVRPDLVPQMAGSDEVVRRLPRNDGNRYWSLVPNERGLQRAIDAGSRAVAFFSSASETFSQRNVRLSISDQLAVFEGMAREAHRGGMELRVYVSAAFVCPYEGRIDPSRVRDVVKQVLDLGPLEVSLADTVGQATPEMVTEVLEAAARVLPAERTALHLHDTNGRALENVEVGLCMGIRSFDAACGGTGGCPFAPGAAGNLATERLVSFLHERGYETGVSLADLQPVATFLASRLRRPI